MNDMAKKLDHYDSIIFLSEILRDRNASNEDEALYKSLLDSVIRARQMVLMGG